VIEDIPAVENKGGLDHGIMDFLIVQMPVKIPFRDDGNRMGTGGSLVGIFDKMDFPGIGILQIDPGILQGFGVRDHDLGIFFQQPPGNRHRRRLTRISRVGLERKPEKAYPLVGQGVEHGMDHVPKKAILLVFIDPDDPLQIIGFFV